MKKKYRITLRESEAIYKSLFEHFPGMIWRSDQHGGILYVNRALMQFTGRTADEVKGRNWLEDVHPDDRVRVEKYQYELIAGKEPFQMEYRLRYHNGDYRWIIDAGTPYEDVDGNYAGYIGMCFDINQRKEAEERLVHVNRLYAVLSQVNQTIVQVKDTDILFERVCTIAVELGKFKMAWIGMYDPELHSIQPVARYGDHTGYLERVSFSFPEEEEKYTPAQVVITTGKSYIINSIEDDPRTASFKDEALKSGIRSAAIFPIRQRDRVVGVFVVYADTDNYFSSEEIDLLEEVVDDISFALQNIADEKTRVKTEMALQQSEERFRTLVQSMDDIVFVLDRDQRHTGVYGKWLEKFGLTEDMFIGKTARDVFNSDSARIHESANIRALTGEHVLYTWIAEMPGGNRLMHISLSPIRNSPGEITGIVGVGRDVTELRQVQELQRLQSAALESAANAIIITDSNGIIQSVNQAFTDLTGYEKEEVIGEKTNILRSGTHSESFYKNLWDTISSGRVWTGEIVNRRKDGSLYTEEMTITPVRDNRNAITHFVAIKQDITQQKEIQHHLLQAQKMESIGTLASGIAHDFNNILGIILGYCTLIERSRSDAELFTNQLATMKQAVNRGANLVQQILTFARKTDVEVDIVNINNSIRELSHMLHGSFPKSISIKLKLDKNLPALVIDQTQVNQALLNLCINARDAILEKEKPYGTITIRTGYIHGKRLQRMFPDAVPDKYVIVRVTDDGTGIDESIRDRIYDPFYSTKTPGKGTGLGLSLVYGIVKTYKGFIDLKSELGQGTTFTLYLPVYQDFQTKKTEEKKVPEDIPRGDETLLIIEDEDLLCKALVHLLENHGYRIIVARDGEEGVEKYKLHKENIALVITDIGLPKMSGTDLVIELQKLNPGVKTILASGFIDPKLSSELYKKGLKEIIRKPFDAEEILQKVRNIIDM